MSLGPDSPDYNSGYTPGYPSGSSVPPRATPDPMTDERSLGDLFAEVSRDLSTLVRQEVALAKAEAMQSAKGAGKGAGMLGGAGYAAGMAILFLSIALWWALGDLIGLGWSALVVAVIWAIIAAVLASRGRKELKRTPTMDQTTDSLKKIPNAVRGREEQNR